MFIFCVILIRAFELYSMSKTVFFRLIFTLILLTCSWQNGVFTRNWQENITGSASQCFQSMLSVNAFSQCFQSMLSVNAFSQCFQSMLSVNAFSQCFQSMLSVNAFSQCFQSMLSVNAFSQCFQSMQVNAFRRFMCENRYVAVVKLSLSLTLSFNYLKILFCIGRGCLC